MNWQVLRGDVRKFCARYDGPPFHAMLTDPPYALNFMSKKWDDDIAFRPETWAALAKHLLPGAFGMSFAGSRGWHRVACAIEDAGLRIHPTIFCWTQGAGFPKAARVKGHEEFAGHRYGLQALKPAVEPIIVFQKPYEGRPVDSIVKHGAGALNIEAGRIGCSDHPGVHKRKGDCFSPTFKGKADAGDCAGKTPAGRWPANFCLSHHPDCHRVGAKKIKTATSVRKNLTGGKQRGYDGGWNSLKGSPDATYADANGLEEVESWECVPDCPVRKLDEQSGVSKSGASGYNWDDSKQDNPTHVTRNIKSGVHFGDSGGASRFFFNSDWNAEVEEGILSADPVRYQAKAAKREREAGLDALEPQPVKPDSLTAGIERKNAKRAASRKSKSLRRNIHPTIKPIKLCTWLAKLLLPPAEYAPRRICIPFSGVSSECLGAMLAGWEEIVGIEREVEYAEIARARLRHWLPDAAEISLPPVENP